MFRFIAALSAVFLCLLFVRPVPSHLTDYPIVRASAFGFTSTNVNTPKFRPFRSHRKATKRVKRTKGCRVTGLNKRSHSRLKRGLCRMSRSLGPVRVTSTCRTKAQNRRVRNPKKRSYHLYNQGCKAADVLVRGKSKGQIIAWWKKNVGGGVGRYCSPSVHVDVGPNGRSWNWCQPKPKKKRYVKRGKKRRYAKRRKARRHYANWNPR